MLGHSKTTENLIASLYKLKESKQEMSNKLKASISRNNQIYQHHSAPSKQLTQNIITNREKSIHILQKKLNDKIKNDEKNGLKLQKEEHLTVLKRKQIEKKIEQISSRNSHRIRQLQLIEEQTMKKIQQQIEKNEVKQKHLRAQYIRIQKQEKKVSQTKEFQKKEAVEQWKLLQSQKWRIENMAKQYQQRQRVLVEEKNPISLKKQQKKKHEQKYIHKEKQYNKLKAPKFVDPKQVGNQYLQQAKLLHKQLANKKNQKNLMNINLKVVNYGADMMDKIFRNTSDLSSFKVVKEQTPIVTNPVVKLEKQEKIMPITMQQKFQFKLSEDLQTERYLKLIKSNLNQLEQATISQNLQQQNSPLPN